MNLNVFNWIREGVKQSVLAGVSDALDHMGTSVDGEDLRPKISEVLRRQTSTVDATPGTEARPRRLGRSLKDLDVGK
jgi:hypothetical protein